MTPSRPLSGIPAARPVRIIDVADKRTRLRLLSLGLAPGVTIQVWRNRNGAVVIGRHHDRMAVGRDLAERILVQEETP
ncbi:ferrous iron transport protein A [Methylomarinovum caldicuralii]|uniref:Ferrous iron transport protein A n=1 Tax=Methylomarinovum caldicuralii TaxID=438856 RepID=A0AAU9CA14_9GAMM|nr:ferrous iron transport protein A [Methylomarinovum caldicuralii]BCX82431.1 ferrous iron transport protein A [Methylomarinovum caldicuralii]